MPRTGPTSKLDAVERAIIRILFGCKGMGFREIHRELEKRPRECRAGSFTTLKKCLDNLEANQVIYKSPVTKKYFFQNILPVYYHRDIIMKAISHSNVLGGGEMTHPEAYPVYEGDKITYPKGRPEICVTKNIFIQANLEFLGFDNEGCQYIWTFPIWPEKPRKNPDKIKKAAHSFKGNLHIAEIAMGRLNPARTAREWIKAIWDYAQKTKLVGEGSTLENTTNEELERIWKEIFEAQQVKSIVSTEFVDPKILLEWLKVAKASKTLNFNGNSEKEGLSFSIGA
jgi:hypothetical protein